MKGLSAPKLKGYAADTVVSEKFEAMVQLGALNSRMKDFYDIWLLMRQFNFKGEYLTEALKRTFAHRKIDVPSGPRLLADDIYLGVRRKCNVPEHTTIDKAGLCGMLIVRLS